MKITNLILGLLFSLALFGQTDYKECWIIQINAQDTSIKNISLIQKFDHHGNLIYEKCQGYYTDYNKGRSDGEYFYRYTDNKLIEKLFVEKSRIDNGFDTTKTTLIYEKEKLVEEKTEKFISRVNQKFEGCEPRFPENFLPKKWYLIGENKYFYDDNGMLIEEYAPEIFYSSQNRYKYEYDIDKRLINKFSYNDNTLIWTENYEYKPKRETMTRTWELDGNYENWTNPLHWRFEKYFDDIGNLIKMEIFYDELKNKNVFHSFMQYDYDEFNKIKKYVSFGEDQKPQIIHKYNYK